MKLIDRPLYMERLKRLKGSSDIKIITGARRSGKSKLMQAFARYIQTEDNSANIIFIDFTKLKYEKLKEYHTLNEYVEQHTRIGVNNYLMIDEVQMCPNFELAVNSLHSSEDYDIYLTGSNAFMLSADLATLFTGRHIEIAVYPFSFQEYVTYFNNNVDYDKAFDHYVVEGGLAGSYPYNDSEEKRNYVKEVYETIITRDLAEKYKVVDTSVLTHLAEYLMDNIGNITSPNNIAKTLTACDTPTTHVTIGKFLKFLCNAFVFYKADRYDIKGKKYLESLNKYYLVDPSIRFALLGLRNMDYGRTYENIVYMELLRRGWTVYIGKLYNKEIDFVAMRGNDKIYIQVSDNISDDATFKREVEPLTKIRDAYSKILIARTRHETYDYQGIKIFDLPSWLRATSTSLTI